MIALNRHIFCLDIWYITRMSNCTTHKSIAAHGTWMIYLQAEYSGHSACLHTFCGDFWWKCLGNFNKDTFKNDKNNSVSCSVIYKNEQYKQNFENWSVELINEHSRKKNQFPSKDAKELIIQATFSTNFWRIDVLSWSVLYPQGTWFWAATKALMLSDKSRHLFWLMDELPIEILFNIAAS